MRRARAKAGVGLGTVVEAEHGGHRALQLVGQMDLSRPAAIGAARMLESFQIDLERVVELGDRTGKDNRPARRVFLDDHETMRVGELPDRRHVRGIGAELLRVLLAAEVTVRPLAPGQLRHPVF